MSKKICIDVTNISPGKGGAGGGIVTYAKNLLLGLDELLKDPAYSKLELLTLGQAGFLDGLKLARIQKVNKAVNNQSFLKRNFWLHVSLPLYLRKNNIQVLHRVIPELPGVKTANYVMTLHDFMFDFYLENPDLKKYLSPLNHLKFLFLRYLMRSGVSSHDIILTPSSAIAKEATYRFPNKEMTLKVTNLATGKNSKARKPLEKEGAEIVLGYVAGFYPHKGHKKAINLMKILQLTERGKKVKLYFRGSKVYQNYYEEIEALILSEGLSSNVFMEGYDPDITIEGIYEKYTATLLLSEYEGFGLPVLESQCFGKPVICSDISVFRENLKDSAIYLTSNPTLTEVEGLLDKLSDGEFLDQLIQKGFENNTQYSWEKTCRESLESYLSLL